MPPPSRCNGSRGSADGRRAGHRGEPRPRAGGVPPTGRAWLPALLGARDVDKGAAAARGTDGDVRTIPLDLSDTGTPARAAREVFDQYGRLDRIVNVSSEAGSLASMGAGTPAYATSKAALNALTRILAAELRGSGILVNAVCPGWVATGMGERGGRPVEEGAAGIVWAATLPDDGPTGGFFRDRRPLRCRTRAVFQWCFQSLGLNLADRVGRQGASAFARLRIDSGCERPRRPAGSSRFGADCGWNHAISICFLQPPVDSGVDGEHRWQIHRPRRCVVRA